MKIYFSIKKWTRVGLFTPILRIASRTGLEFVVLLLSRSNCMNIFDILYFVTCLTYETFYAIEI